MVQAYQGGIPGSYATKDGVPAGCVQLEVYSPWDRHGNCPDQPDVLTAYFLIDAVYESAIRATPTQGVWRIRENNTCTFATAWVRLPDSHSHLVYLHEEIFKMSVINRIPDGFKVVAYNWDWYDCRAKNLRICRKKPLATNPNRQAHLDSQG